MKSRCVCRGQETGTGGCWAIGLRERTRSSTTSDDEYLSDDCVADKNLVLEVVLELSAGGWLGQCARSSLHSHH